MNLLFFGIYITFTIMDFIQLMKEKKKNDIIAFSVLSLIIFVAAIVYYMNEYHDSFTDNLLRLLKME